MLIIVLQIARKFLLFRVLEIQIAIQPFWESLINSINNATAKVKQVSKQRETNMFSSPVGEPTVQKLLPYIQAFVNTSHHF